MKLNLNYVQPVQARIKQRSLDHAILKPWLLHEEVHPLLIMWTHTQNTSLWHWQPNHFVPCLQPATFPETKPAEKDIFIFSRM